MIHSTDSQSQKLVIIILTRVIYSLVSNFKISQNKFQMKIYYKSDGRTPCVKIMTNYSAVQVAICGPGRMDHWWYMFYS